MKKILFTLLILSISFHAAAQNNELAEKKYTLAIEEVYNGNLKEAINLIDQAIKNSKPEYKVKMMLDKAYIYKRFNENKNALKVLKKLIRKYPKNTNEVDDAKRIISESEKQSYIPPKNTKKAIKAFNEAIDLVINENYDDAIDKG